MVVGGILLIRSARGNMMLLDEIAGEMWGRAVTGEDLVGLGKLEAGE